MFPIDWLYTSTWKSRGRKFQGASIYTLKNVSISVLTFRLFTTKPGLLLQWKRPVGKLIGKDWQRNFCVLNFESSTSLNIIFPCHFWGSIFWDAGTDSRHLNYVVCLSNPRSEDPCTVLVIFQNRNLNSKSSWSFIERMRLEWNAFGCGACFFGFKSAKSMSFLGGNSRLKGGQSKKRQPFWSNFAWLEGFLMRCCTVLVLRSCKKSWLCDFCHGLQPRSRADGAAILPFCCPTGLRENLLMLLILFYQHVVPVKFQMGLLFYQTAVPMIYSSPDV